MKSRQVLLLAMGMASPGLAFYTPSVTSRTLVKPAGPSSFHVHEARPKTQFKAVSASPRRHTALHAAAAIVDIAEVVKSSPLGSILSNLSSVLVLALIVAVHELGHFLGARSQGIKVENFSIGFGPTLFSYKPPNDDVEYTIRAFPAGGFVSFPKFYEVDEDGEIIRYQDPDLLQNRKPWEQAIVISAGVIANIIFSFSLLFGTVATAGLPRPQFSEGPYVVKVLEKDCPAGLAGVQSEDIILAVNGKSVPGNEKGLNEAVALISKSGSSEIDLQLKRKGEVITKKVQPRVSAVGRASIGVQMASHVEKVDVIKAKDFGEALMYTSQEFSTMLQEATSSITRITQATSLDGLTGPLGIVQVGADLAKVDPLALIKFSAFISINLAVVNALPVPGLDGGQMVFVLLELLRGKKMDIRIQNGIQAIAVLILASLSFYLITGDVTRGVISPIQKALESGQIQIQSPLK